MSIHPFLSLFETQMAELEFEGATRTLKQLQMMGLGATALQILTARLYDATDRTVEAESLYRQVLKSTDQPALLTQARQGLQVIHDRERQFREAAVALAMTHAEAKGPGILYLFPIDPSQKEKAAETLSRIFRLDIYTARMHLPLRYLKIYRIGRYGELSVWAAELGRSGVKAMAISVAALNRLPIHLVQYLQPDREGCVAVTEKGEYSIGWEQIGAQVRGLLPLFEEVVMGVDKNYKVVKEEQTQDYCHVRDLHCGDFILRLCDQTYQFSRGKQVPGEHLTVHHRWHGLMEWIEGSTIVPTQDAFLSFAEMALLYPETLEAITPRLGLRRNRDSLWDNCFQLYSGTLFLQSQGSTENSGPLRDREET